MRRLLLSVIAIAFSITMLSANGTAMAQDAETEGAIKYRKAVMTAVRGHMGAMAGILKGSGNKADLTTHADAMVSMSKISATVFPEGSDFGETTALPAVWEKPDDFAMAIKTFQDAAANVATAAKGGDMAAFGQAFGGLGKSCKDCHENFREKKEKKWKK